jgi:hypothetical protein
MAAGLATSKAQDAFVPADRTSQTALRHVVRPLRDRYEQNHEQLCKTDS